MREKTRVRHWDAFKASKLIKIREIVFLAEIFPLHFGLKYTGDDLFSGLFSVFFIASAERTFNYLVDRQNQNHSFLFLMCRNYSLHN